MIKKINFFALSISCVLIYCFLYFYLGEDSFINPVDSLDSNVVWYKVLSDNSAQFWTSNALIDGMVGIQPRHVYPSEFDPILWIYSVLPAFWAFAFNFLIVHLVAFLSMYFFLQKVFKLYDKESNKLYASCGALIFALIPFWTHAGVSSAGLPLLGLAFLYLEEKRFVRGLGFSIFYVLYSSLILSGIFVLAIYALWLLSRLIRDKVAVKYLQNHLINFLCMTLVYVIANYRLFDSILLSDYVSHRVSKSDLIGQFNFKDIFRFPWYQFVFEGQWHAGKIFPLISIFTLFFTVRYLIKGQVSRSLKSVCFLNLGVIFLSFIFGNELSKQLLGVIPVIGSLQLDRFYILIPFTMTLTFIFLLYNILPSLKYGRMIFFVLILISTGFYFAKDYNWNNSLKSFAGIRTPGIQFSKFYEQEDFYKIKSKLAEESYSRVVSLGFHPAVTVFNGIRSADGYMANYALDSKKAFRRIIGGELEKNQTIESYFDSWGSRCYFFNSQLGREFRNVKTKILDSMSYDFEFMKSEGISHIISLVPIDEELAEKLELVLVYKNVSTGYLLYRI